MIPRRAARRDENEPAVVEALQAAGWVVTQLSQEGVPDLLCTKGKRIVLIEVVGDAKAARYRDTRGLTPAQVEWHRANRDAAHVVRSPEDALRIVRRAR
jgi:hypothetical protein